MRLYPLVSIAGLVGLLTCSVAVAQDLDAKWLVGKWQGEVQTVRARAQPEIRINSDGTFEGEAQRQQGGLLQYKDGKWKIAGDTVTFEFVVDTAARDGRYISKVTWTVKRKGDDLEGTGIRESDSAQLSVKLRKMK